MEFFTILNHSDVFKKSFVENCEDIGSDLDDFNLSNFMKKISSEFEETFRSFFNDLKTGLKEKWTQLSPYLIFILIIIFLSSKMGPTLDHRHQTLSIGPFHLERFRITSQKTS